MANKTEGGTGEVGDHSAFTAAFRLEDITGLLSGDLETGLNGSPELVTELQKFTRTRLSAHAHPREIAFVDGLPKTPSGKVQRFVLRQRLAT